MSERSPDPVRYSYAGDALAALLTISIFMAAAGAGTAFSAAGGFLFRHFHFASLYFPGLIFLGCVLLRAGRFPRRVRWILFASPVIFLTLAVFLQTAVGNMALLASRVLIDSLGRFAASLLTFLLLSLELLGLWRLTRHLASSEDRLIRAEDIKERFRSIVSFLGLDPAETAGDAEAPRAGDDEPTLQDKPQMSFPSFPDMAEPVNEKVPLFPEAPEKPFPPGVSAASDPAVEELIRRTLRGENAPSAPAAAPAEPVSPSEPAPSEPPAARNADEVLWVQFPDRGNAETPVVLPEAEKLSSAFPEPPDVPSPPLPEEERDIADISGKLDPQGTGPVGVVTEKKPHTRSRRRKKYEVPVEGVLAEYSDDDFTSIDENTRRGAGILEQTLKEFKIEAKVTGIRKGPVITMYELLPSPGVKISSIVNLQDNIALRLAASRLRMVAPIPGKHAIGIEVPNKKRAIVSFTSLVNSDEFRETDAGIPVILGKDISGGNQVIDLTRTPHLLIAGATGSGKSVCVNSLIGSILYSRTPQEVKMIMVDPKIVELKLYNDIPHLLTPVITEPKKALQALQWCLYEMERRYALLDTQGVRDMKSYNRRVKERKLATEPLPYIVVLVDEFADLMATSGKELEGIVARLAAMSRAVGIHLVLATQRPSVDVITGLIKANFPSRIAFMVAGKTDSRIIIDAVGAEKLLGRGDMLFTSAWDPFPSRMQGAFLAEEEVERMAEYVKTLGEPDYIDEEMFFDDEEEEEFRLEADDGDDPVFDKALEIVVTDGTAGNCRSGQRFQTA